MAPEAEPLLPEALDDGGMTPPHGDPLPLGAPTALAETADVAPEPPADEPLDDASSTPPHGDPLHLAPVTSTLAKTADGAGEPPVDEPLDDASSTPPHGDPLHLAPVTSTLAEATDGAGEPPVDEPLDDASSTPPHGDPLHLAPVTSTLAETADVAPEPPVDEPLDDASSTPPHGDPLRVSAVPTATWTADPAFEQEAAVLTTGGREAPTLGGGEPPVDFGADGFEVSAIGGAPLEAAGAQQEFADRSEYHSDPPFASSATVLESLYSPDVNEGEGTQPADALEAAALGHPGAVVLEAPGAGEVEAPEERREGGPNWMLAFICAWSGATSLFEAWTLMRSGGMRVELLQNLGFVGYLLLGLGLAVFAIEALGWGRPRRGVAPVLLPTALTLAGVVCLVLWNDPGRPI